MSAHTPGPWRVMQFGENQRVVTDAMCINGLVAAVQVADCGQPQPDDEMHDHAIRHSANAHLIAAAPELLEACKTFAEWLRREDAGPVYPEGTNRDTPGNEDAWREWYDGNLEICDRAVKQARAAIAKAEGREP